MSQVSKPFFPSIPQLLKALANRDPQGIAIVAPSRASLSFSDLHAQTEKMARTLNAMGVGRNDRVVVVVPNGPEMASAFFSVASAATCAPLNPAYSASEFDFFLSDLNAKALIVQSGIDSPAIAVAQKHRLPVVELSPRKEAAAGIFSVTGQERPDPTRYGFAQAGDVALILYTSGTTSRPKMVLLTHANLMASAQNIVTTLRLNEADRCLNVMPLFHIHGLVGALLSSVTAGGSIVCMSSFNIEQFFPWIERYRPTWYTAVPTIHHAVLLAAQTDRSALKNHSLRFIRSSSSALPVRLMEGLEENFKVPVIESYGMTEAAHQMASNPLPPGERKAGSVGVAAGPEIAIMDEAGNLLSSGETGEIVIRGANVMHGYDNNNAANGLAFTQGWFRTGDQGYLDQNGYLFITGRFKEIINRGGEKISPIEIDQVLLAHPAVTEAIAFAVSHFSLGEDIAAAVVLKKQVAATTLELQQFVASRLADFKVPRQIIIVDALPKTATGKIQRIGLAEKLGVDRKTLPAPDQGRPESQESYVAPRSAFEQTLSVIWAKLFGMKQVGIDDNFFDLGGDSLLAVRLIAQVEKLTGKHFPLAGLFQAPTIEAQAKLLCQDGWSTSCDSLLAIQPGGSKPPLFCVHADDGGVLFWRELSRRLGPDQPFYALQPMGLDGKRDPCNRIEEMASHYINEIKSLQPAGPYFLAGHCVGGLIAFEMAQQIHSQGERVALLALLDSFPPRDRLPRRKNYPLRNKMHHLVQLVKLHLSNLFLLEPGERFIYLRTKCNKLLYKTCMSIGFPWVNAARARRQILTAMSQAKRVYHPKSYPGRVTVFRATKLPAGFENGVETQWARLAAGGLETHLVPAYFAHTIYEPRVQVLAEKLAACLDRV